MQKLNKEQIKILRDLVQCATEQLYWNKLYNLTVYEINHLGSGSITGGMQHYNPVQFSRIGKQLVGVAQLCENAIQNVALKYSRLFSESKKKQIPIGLWNKLDILFTKPPKALDRKVQVDKFTLQPYLHEGPSQKEAIALLRKQMETASSRESDMLWDSIQVLEGPLNVPLQPHLRKTTRIQKRIKKRTGKARWIRR